MWSMMRDGHRHRQYLSARQRGSVRCLSLSSVCLVSFVVCSGTSIVECQGRAVPGTARCVEPWSKTDL